MNTIFSFLIEVLATLVLCALTFLYLRPFLIKVLVDLCGSEERAQFWTVFSSILLIGLPLLNGLMYHPEARKTEEVFFELTRRISGNLIGFMVALVGIGFIVSIIAVVAPRAKELK